LRIRTRDGAQREGGQIGAADVGAVGGIAGEDEGFIRSENSQRAGGDEFYFEIIGFEAGADVLVDASVVRAARRERRPWRGRGGRKGWRRRSVLRPFSSAESPQCFSGLKTTSTARTFEARGGGCRWRFSRRGGRGRRRRWRGRWGQDFSGHLRGRSCSENRRGDGGRRRAPIWAWRRGR